MTTMQSRRTRWPAAAVITLGVALLLGVISAAQNQIANMNRPNHWTLGHALIMETPFFVIWALLLPLVLLALRRVPLQRGTLTRAVPIHLLIGVGITMLHYSIGFFFMGWIGHHDWTRPGHTFSEHFIPDLRYSLLPNFASYLFLFTIIVAWQYYKQLRERELLTSQLSAQLSQAKLQALRMQLNPHFLFNAMNSISMLVRRNDNTQAVRMLAGLSDLLRYVLEDSPADEVPLRDELSFLQRYLEIEKVRFQDRLHIHIDAAEETLDAFVPNLLLQPLVENAIRHGVARKVTPGRVEIAARRLGDRLIVQVQDDGPGLGPSLGGSGVGLANTRSRLEQLYGAEQSFELRAGQPAGAVATLSLPFHTTPAVQVSAA
jgi:two-component system, LytTR family, sensor kinase